MTLFKNLKLILYWLDGWEMFQ